MTDMSIVVYIPIVASVRFPNQRIPMFLEEENGPHTSIVSFRVKNMLIFSHNNYWIITSNLRIFTT